MCVIYGTLRLFNMSKVALLLYPHYFGGIYPICGFAQNGLCHLKVLAGELV